MKTRFILGVGGLLLLFGGVGIYYYRVGTPRRTALQTLSTLQQSLRANDAANLLQTVAIPAALHDRTEAEQVEFLSKALRDEVTEEGLTLLKKEGDFGALTEIFPQEGLRWAEQAGVKPEDCVAFKLERDGLRTEVVLAKDSTPRAPPNSFKIVRCNNVFAPALVQLSTKAKP